MANFLANHRIFLISPYTLRPKPDHYTPMSFLNTSACLLWFQKQDGHMQRFIREVNTTSRACVLWDLEEETDYIVQVQSIGLYGESQASKRVHFKTLKKSDRFPSNSSNQGTKAYVFRFVLWLTYVFFFFFFFFLLNKYSSMPYL